MELYTRLMSWTIYQNGSASKRPIHFDKLLPLHFWQVCQHPGKLRYQLVKGGYVESAKGFLFWTIQSVIGIWKRLTILTTFMVVQGRVSNGVERVSFWKSQTSPLGCVLQSEPPGLWKHNSYLNGEKIIGMKTNNLNNMFYGNFNVGASETSLPL